MAEPNERDGSHSDSEIAEGINAAARVVSGAVTLQRNPVEGATQVISGLAGAAGVAGVEGAQEAAEIVNAVSALASAVRNLPNDPMRALSDLVQGGAERMHVHYSFRSKAHGGLDWQVRRVVLEERMDRPYEATIDLANDDTTADPLSLLGEQAELVIERHSVRIVQGVVRRVERGGSGGTDRSVTAKVYLVPALWTLS